MRWNWGQTALAAVAAATTLLVGCGRGAPSNDAPLTTSEADAPGQGAIDASGSAAGDAAVLAGLKQGWQGGVAAIPETKPDSADQIWQRVQGFEVLAVYLQTLKPAEVDGKDRQMTPSARADWSRFRSALIAKQLRVLPILRQAYVKILGDKLWEDNVYVTGNGRHISFNGAIFADNANIKAAHEANLLALTKLRFSRDDYGLCKSCARYEWPIVSPPDSAIGSWTGSQLSQVQ